MELGPLIAAYDRSAETYDARFLALQAPKIRGLRAALPTPLPTPAVDLGAGTGLVARMTGSRPLALDASAEMLARALDPRVRADLHRLPLRTGAFGLAWMVTSLVDFGDPGPAIREVRRVLAPGGWLALSVLRREDLGALERALTAGGLEVVVRLDLGQDAGYVARAAG